MNKRPTWEELWLRIARDLSYRSHDPDTKHGAVIVSRDNIVLGAGYNGYPRGGGEENYPDTRPEKYRYIIHAEANAICQCQGGRQPDSVIYVTGLPCSNCFGLIIQAGIKRVVCGPTSSWCVDEDEVEAVKLMTKVHDIRVQIFSEWPDESWR